MKKYVPILLSLLVLAVMSCATVGGDEKIKDTVEDIRKKEAEAEKKRKERREREEDKEKEWRCEDRDEDRDDSRRGEGGANLVWLEYVASIRFAAYPYAPSSPYAFSTTTWFHPDETKLCALQLESSAAYHFGGTYANLNRVTFQLAALHLNLIQQNFFAVSERFSVVSLNAGYSLVLPDFLLSGYAGGYWLDFLDRPLPSFGLSCQVFLPGGFYLDLYNLNAALPGHITHLAGSVNFAVWRFGFAVGYTYNYFTGNVFHGPSLGISFWL